MLGIDLYRHKRFDNTFVTSLIPYRAYPDSRLATCQCAV